MIERQLALEELALNIASAWFYGNWKVETLNEFEQQELLTKLGHWPVTEDEIMERRYAIEKLKSDKSIR